MHKATIIKWEAGGGTPGDEYLRRMETHWGLEPDWLVAQKCLNFMETAKIDPALIVKYAPKSSGNSQTEEARPPALVELERLYRLRKFDEIVAWAMRQMRAAAFSQAVHAFEDSMEPDELERRLREAGIDYQRGTDLPEPPKKRSRKR